MKIVRMAVSVLLVVTATPALAEKKPKGPLSVAESQFKVTLKDDSLEPKASFDTSMVQRTRAISPGLEGDSYVRAWLDKKTGETSFQIYSVVNYYQNWRFYVLANYETPTGPAQVELTKIAAEVLSCRYGCEFAEAVGFPIDEKTVQSLASQPEGTTWRYRLKSKAGIDADMTMEAAEFAGILGAINQYRTEHNLAVPK